MNVRDLKLAIVCDNETDEMKSLNSFFDNLFSDLKIYTDGDKPNLIFMKGDKCFMEQDLINGYLWCRYKDFWEVLAEQYHCNDVEIQGIVEYKVESLKMESLRPIGYYIRKAYAVKDGSCLCTHLYFTVEEAFKMGSLIPYKN